MNNYINPLTPSNITNAESTRNIINKPNASSQGLQDNCCTRGDQ